MYGIMFNGPKNKRDKNVTLMKKNWKYMGPDGTKGLPSFSRHWLSHYWVKWLDNEMDLKVSDLKTTMVILSTKDI